MKTRVETARTPTVRDIDPLIASDTRRLEFAAQRTRSEKALEECRRPRLRDWLVASIPLGIFYAMFLALGAIMVSFWWNDGVSGREGETAYRATAAVAAIFALASCAALYRVSRFRAWRKACAECGPEERAWHERFLAMYPKVHGFDRRLDALRHFSQNAEEGADIDEDVILKYAEERETLDREMRTLNREQALRAFEKAVDESVDGRYRGTRDVTDLLFVHRARHEDADRELAMLTAPDQPSHIRVTGTVPVSRPPAEEPDDDADEEEGRAPDTLRSQRA